jgi:hypothetical protein
LDVWEVREALELNEYIEVDDLVTVCKVHALTITRQRYQLAQSSPPSAKALRILVTVGVIFFTGRKIRTCSDLLL